MAEKDFKVKHGLFVTDSANINNLTVRGDANVSGSITVTGNFVGEYAGFDSDFNQKTTTNLTEGDNLYYTTSRADSDFDSRLSTKSTDDLTEGDNLYYTSARADSDFDVRLVTKSTDDLTEGDNLYYTTARADSDFDVRLSTKSTDNLTEGDNLYYTTSRADSDFDVRLSTKSTDNLTEGDNLYYTTARADSDFDTRLSTKSTTNLTEGDNLYYTTARADSDFDVRLSTKSTDDLTEGDNLYYTTARADSDAKNAVSVTDAGGDGSISYNNATGTITYTGPSATETRAHLVAGTGVNYDSANGVVSIGQSVGTSDTVTFATVNTGQGANELYAMDQDVRTTDNVAFGQIDGDSATMGQINFKTDWATDHIAFSEGAVWYDPYHKNLNYYTDLDHPIELGMQLVERVYNDTGSTILKGKPLYYSGNRVDTAGQESPTVALANATSSTKYNVQGLAGEDIANGAYGLAVVAGVIDGFDTSGLNAGANFFVGLEDGAVQNAAPSYPNYPMCLGWVIKSDASDGKVIINQQNHSVNTFRVQGDTHIGDDLVIDGNLTVKGTQTITSTENVSIGGNFQYLNAGNTIGEAGTGFVGTGLDDAFFAGHYSGDSSSKSFFVKIDATGTPDTFEWGFDSDVGTEATGIAITSNEQLLDSDYGISINFGTTTGHTIGDKWTGSATALDTDTGFFSNKNEGDAGNGYTHIGVYWDASQNEWTFVGAYDPEPEAPINRSDGSFAYGDIRAKDIYATNVTGTFIGSASQLGGLTSSQFLRSDTADTKTSGDLSFSDNVKAIFGAGSDLQIFHNGTHSYIQDTGVGNLRIDGADIQLRDISTGNLYFLGQQSSGEARLYHSGSNKLATTSTGIDVTGNTESDTVTIGVSSVAGSEKLRVNGTVLTLGGSVSAPAIGIGDVNTGVYAPTAGQLGWTVNGTQRLFLDNTGIDVTGTVTADGLTVESGSTSVTATLASLGNGVTDTASIDIYRTNAGHNTVEIVDKRVADLDGGNLVIRTSDTNGTMKDRMLVGEGGDISFYEATGTTPKLTWDASDEALEFADNAKATFGAGSDLQIYHDGSNSYIKDAGTGVLNVQGSSQVNIGGANGTIGFQFVEGANASLRHNNVVKLTTTSTGIAVTGDANFADNGKAIFGAGSDLQIYHDGPSGNSFISESGTGNLKITGENVRLEDASGNRYMQGVAGGASNLYYAGGVKLSTTSTGIDVNGTVTADGLTVESTATTRPTIGNSDVNTSGLTTGLNFKPISNLSDGAKLNIISGFQPTVTSAYTAGFEFVTQDHAGGGSFAQTKALSIGAGGDISFYEDTGTTAKFFWDASEERLGLTGSDYQFYIQQGTNQPWYHRAISNGKYALHLNGTGDIITLDTSGNVGIGDTNPVNGYLTIRGASTSGTTNSHIMLTGDGATVGEGPQIVFSESGTASNWVGASIGFERTGGGGIGNLIFSTRRSTGDANTVATEAMRIDSSGNLNLTGLSNGRLNFAGGNTSGGSKIQAWNDAGNANGYLAIEGYSSEYMRIDASGNVGIGTSSPEGNLHIQNGAAGTITTSNSQLVIENNTTARLTLLTPNTNGGTIEFGDPEDQAAGRINYDHLGNFMRLYTAGSERLRIDSSGNVGIGTSNATPSNGEGLCLGSSSTITRLDMRNTTTGDATGDGTSLQLNGNNFTIENREAGYVAISTSLAERMRIDSSGNVGIGTSSPSVPLAVSRNLTGVIASFTNQTSADFQINLSSGVTLLTPSTGILAFGTSNTERMRIDSSGNLIVGNTTDSAASSITLQNDGDIRGVLASGAGGDTLISAISGVSNGYQIVVDASNNQTYKWHNGGTQSMTLDSSGNLLVGKTSANNTTAGTTIYGSAPGNMSLVRDSGSSIVMNRLNSDGDIAVFRKDGTTVGSIGTYGGRVYLADDNQGGISFSSGSKTLFSTNNVGSVEDAAMDIGSSSYRFKDLHLSGSVVLDEAALTSQTATTATTSQTAIATFAAATYGSAEVLIQAKDGSNRHLTKLLITHNGTTAIATEYGTVVTSSNLATYEVDINSGNVRVLATPASTNSTVFKMTLELIEV